MEHKKKNNQKTDDRRWTFKNIAKCDNTYDRLDVKLKNNLRVNVTME